MVEISRAVAISFQQRKCFLEPELVDGFDVVEISPSNASLGTLLFNKVRGLTGRPFFNDFKNRRGAALLQNVLDNTEVGFEGGRDAGRKRTKAKGDLAMKRELGTLPQWVDITMPPIMDLPELR